jgi:hypothetical protein
MQTPASYWREIVLSGMRRLDPDDIHGQLEAEYNRARSLLERLLADPNSPPAEVEAARLEVFFLGVALLTFGHLDVVENVLSNIPAYQTPPRMLANSLAALIPFPGEANPMTNRAAAVDWFRRHQARLRWDEESGRFVLLPLQ